MRGIGLLTILIAVTLSSAASAIVIGGSNLGLFGYPSHDCRKPYNKPIQPYQFTTQWEVDQYNAEVDQYNFEVKQFFSCVEEYIDNAENDVDRITEKVDEAISDANLI